jgi:membrane-associated PAP2 superfamily phosphatase
MNRTGLIIALAIAAGGGLLFGLYPALDLAIARHFHDYVDASNNAFAWRIYPPLMSARDAGLWIGTVLVAPAVAALVVKLIVPRRKMLISGRAVIFLVSTLALAPGLVVNVVLKDHWSRPRPIDVAQLGGNEKFVAWWDPRGDCATNCSFVSGDVAGTAWTLAPAALAPPQWRALAYGAALALTAGMAAIRVMAGAHFVSDTLFAAVFTFLIVWVVHGLIYRWPRTRLSEEAVESAIEQAGLALRDGLAWFGYRAANEIAGTQSDEDGDEKFKRRKRGWW